ncbi:MAG: hypothetical protein EBU66_13915 [Bacteroidetes bacterium]|nr:hypothetical protein [bacterium]NBP65744.1 hypothetical protein [Bacteroidota bacterium]
MASSKKVHRKDNKKNSEKRSRSRRSRRRSCSSGGNNKKKNGTRRWHQKGCQSGGGSMTGGWPWGPSDVQHAGNGGAPGGTSNVPQSINGNHYPLNTETMALPQSSNHLVEKGMFGGRGRRSRGRGHRRYIGEQSGGMAEYLPETVNTGLRGMAETPLSISNALQGDSTAFVTSNPTIQPIAQPVELK